VATGQVLNERQSRHFHGEVVAFLNRSPVCGRGGSRIWQSTTTPSTSMLRCGRGSTSVQESTCTSPTDGSWLNLAEVFFVVIDRQTLRPGDVASLEELVAAATDQTILQAPAAGSAG